MCGVIMLSLIHIYENFDLLNALPEKEWHGGRVHEVRENILHLMRGQISVSYTHLPVSKRVLDRSDPHSF